jgi:hypothetical protein
LVWALCGRESIFLFSHTNEFCGKSKVAPEAGVAWPGLKVGRRVCERGQQRKQLPARCSSPQGKPQRAQRLCRFRRYGPPTLETGPQTPVPYLAGTFRGPLLGATLRPDALGHRSLGPEELTGLTRPPRSRRPSVPARLLGMPRGGGRRNTLPPPKDGLCGRLADGKSYHQSSGRQPPCSGRRMGETARRVLLLGPLGHTTRLLAGKVACRRVPWGTKRGKADCRPRRSKAPSRRPPRNGAPCGSRPGRHPVTCNISPALKHAPVANPGER